MKGIIIVMIIMLTSMFTGCTAPAKSVDQNTFNAAEGDKKIEYTEQPVANAENTESNPENKENLTPESTNTPSIEEITSEYALLINDVTIPLRAWDNNLDLEKILGEPVSQEIEQLGDGADTFKGSFHKTLIYDGLQIKLNSPSDNGKTFWISEMVVSTKEYKTSKGIGIGDTIENITDAYPTIEIFPDGRTDPSNCAYVLHREYIDYLKFEVTEGIVSHFHIFYAIP